MQLKQTHSNQEKGFSRRSFLKLSGLLGIGTASAFLLPPASEAVKLDRKKFKVSSTRPAMGTLVTMILVHESRDRAQEAMGWAFEEMDRLSAIFNRYERATAIGHLNSEGRLPEAPPEVLRVVSRALTHYELTGGAFDITVKPVVDLFKERFQNTETPKVLEKELDQILELVDSRGIVLGDREIRFSRPGMGLTLDGIAKGYIVDRISEYLKKKGVENHLVNAGGDICTCGSRADGKPWTIAIEDPEKCGEYPDVVRMRSGAVATSGNYEIYYDRDKMVHHIVNPRSGKSPNLFSSVSVRAGSAMDADALATGVYVLERDKGLQLVNSLPGCESLVIDGAGRQWTSGGWKKASI